MRTVISLAVVAAALLAVAYAHADDAVVARVNGTPITETQIKDMAERMQQGGDADPSTPAVTRDDALRSLIDIEVLRQQAEAEKVEVPTAEVEAQIGKIKQGYPTPDAFQQALTDSHTTEADVRREIGRGLQMQKLVERHVTVTLPANAIEDYYKRNPEKFQHPDEVRASHILFRTAPGADEAAVKQHATDALGRLKKGEDFAKLAKELSEDTGSGQNGGDLGFFPHDAVVKPFADAAFGLKKGELSDVVQTQFGFHIIKVTDTRAAGVAPLTEVKPEIQNFLEEQERDHQEHVYIDGLKKQAKIEMAAEEKSAATPSPGK